MKGIIIMNIITESILRKKAKSLGVGVKKSREVISIDNFGEYLLYDLSSNTVIAGGRFDLTLSEAYEFLEEMGSE